LICGDVPRLKVKGGHHIEARLLETERYATRAAEKVDGDRLRSCDHVLPPLAQTDSTF
jgi:hypothetical protein